MKPLFALVLLAVLGMSPGLAADGTTSKVDTWKADRSTVFDASEIDLEEFKWVARPLVVFAEAPQMPAFQSQMELLTDRLDELAIRDVVIVTDTDPAEKSDLRRKLRPRGFMLVLIGKDGGVKLRKPFPWDVRELSRQIDKMPIRQQEIRDALNGE